MTIDRMDRISELIKREISVILQTELNDPRTDGVTITKVEVSRDLRNAKVFYVPSGVDGNADSIARGLKSCSSFVRGELSRRIAMKFTPYLTFFEDSKAEKEGSIDKIFDVVEKELGIEGETDGETNDETDDERMSDE
ncbi:MAG: 30S ribosome-binding factor RbfA [Candidatus Tantalella remota]|nr:30S ribosome-binding factor RbfA [Candidatus Tantalella remota]